MKKHWVAIVLAVVVGIICITPYLYFTFTPEYKGVDMIAIDAEDHYIARIQEIYDGHWGLGNTFLPNKDQPYSIGPLGEIIVALFGMTLGLTSAQAALVSKFVFPLIVALLVYTLVFLLSKSKAAAVVSTSFVMLADGLLQGPSAWFLLLKGTSWAGIMGYSRPINPEISSLFMYGALILFYINFFSKEKPRLLYTILLGLIAGVSLYVSPFTATFLCATIAASFVWFIFKRQFSQAIHTILVGVATIVAVVPFLFNYMALKASPWYAEFAMRSGLQSGHQFVFSAWLLILLILVLVAWPKRFAPARPFFGAAVVALWALTEQQILTGVSLQSSHYHWYVTLPLATMVLGMYAVTVIDFFINNQKARIALYGLCCLVVVYNGVVRQVHGYTLINESSVATQKYAAPLSYINSLKNEEVVWANSDISRFIPIYTKSDAPNSPQTLNYLVPTPYVHKLLFLNYRLRGITPKNVLETMTTERVSVSSAIYAMYWSQQKGDFAAIPDSILESLAKEYIDLYPTPIQDLFKDLQISMILWDKDKDPSWNISSLSFTKEVYSSGSLKVFLLNNTNPTKPTSI